jgi:hypothetical protein
MDSRRRSDGERHQHRATRVRSWFKLIRFRTPQPA